MPTLAGQPIIAITTLRDTTGSLVTGATWNVLYSRHQSGTVATTVAARLRRQVVTVTAPVATTGTVEITQGDDYL